MEINFVELYHFNEEYLLQHIYARYYHEINTIVLTI